VFKVVEINLKSPASQRVYLFCFVQHSKTISGGNDMKKLMNLFLAMPFLAGSGFACAGSLFEGNIVGIPTAQQVVRGVGGGLLPWVSDGKAQLQTDGKLEVNVAGLLFSAGPPIGTVGPITHVRASLTCEGSGVVATTEPVPLSAAGDARIEEIISAPANCIGPIVLIRIGGTASAFPLLGPWIAATGF
jgi:hypothetical protein